MLNYRKKFVFFLITTAMVFGGCFGVAGKVEAEYFAAGTSTSINLLEGMDVPSIDSFYCNASSVPSGTALKFRYSTTSTSGPWVNSNGTKDGWDEVATTGGATTSLSGLNWGGSIFYYQVRLESDTNGSTPPELDKIELNYSNPPPHSTTNPLPAD